MWRVEYLVERNAGHKVQEFAPGFTFFGSNGAGEAYALDWRPTRKAHYVVIPFITPEPDAAVPCGDWLVLLLVERLGRAGAGDDTDRYPGLYLPAGQ